MVCSAHQVMLSLSVVRSQVSYQHRVLHFSTSSTVDCDSYLGVQNHLQTPDLSFRNLMWKSLLKEPTKPRDVPQRHILGWKAIHTWNEAYQLLGHFVKESETMSSRLVLCDSWIACSSIGIGIMTAVRTDKLGLSPT